MNRSSHNHQFDYSDTILHYPFISMQILRNKGCVTDKQFEEVIKEVGFYKIHKLKGKVQGF